MHKEILTTAQQDLLPLVKSFSKNFGLVGGTAIALHIGHRQSIDFDLFTAQAFGTLHIRNRITDAGKKIEAVLRDAAGEYTVVIQGVRFTFFHYPFAIEFSEPFDDIIHLPDLRTLAAMKAYALGRRAKWKDYVDLYFIMENFFDIHAIVATTKKIFGVEFNEKIFRSQLAYFEDVDYSEKVIYCPGCEVDDTLIKQKSIEYSLR